MIGIPDMGLCDLSLRECARTAVIARNFVAGHGLNCRLVQFKVNVITSVLNLLICMHVIYASNTNQTPIAFCV